MYVARNIIHLSEKLAKKVHQKTDKTSSVYKNQIWHF